MHTLFFIIFTFFSTLAWGDGSNPLDTLFRRGQTNLQIAHNRDLTPREQRELLDEAILAFEEILENNHYMPKVHFELAHALFLKGDHQSAKKHFLLVMASNPPQSVIEEVNQFLAAIKHRETTILARAQELLQDNRLAEALIELKILTEIHSDDLDILLLLGQTALEIVHNNPDLPKNERNKLLDEAIVAYESILDQNPELPQVRLDLSLAYSLKGKKSSAKKYFDQVLRQDTPLITEKNINNFLEAIEQQKPWKLKIKASGVYNSNIENKHKSVKKSGMGVVLKINAEYQYELNEQLRTRIGGELKRKQWVYKKFNKTELTNYIGMLLFIGNANHLGISATFKRIWKGVYHKPKYYDVGVRIESSHDIDSQLTISTSGHIYNRTYDNSPTLDGPGGDFHAMVSYALSPKFQMRLKLGYGYDRPKGETMSRHQRNTMELGFTTGLLEPLMIETGIEIKNINYENNDGWYPYIGDSSREDQVRAYRIDVYHKRFKLLKFKPKLYLKYEELESGAEVAEYETLMLGFDLVRKF